jgi:uncharacterized protein YndB with AHSA1/START domain
MSDHHKYRPGPAAGAQVRRDGDRWALVVVRELRHPPPKVWQALTAPEHLREWAPFDSDRNLGTAGATARLSTVGTPTPHVTETRVKRAEAPTALEYAWGEFDMRWELEPLPDGGTRLTLLTNIGHRFVSWGAAGWHICLDVLDQLLAGCPVGRIVGAEAMKFDWQRLNTEYAEQFGVEAPSWPPKGTQP